MVIRPLVVLISFFAAALAQTPASTPTTPESVPQYLVAAGGAYNYYSAPAVTAGWTSFAARVPDTNVYSFSTVDMTRQAAAIRTGVAYLITRQGNWSLLALGDAGVATDAGVSLGSFSAGGVVAYDIGQKLKKGHFYLLGAVRMLKNASNSPQPVFEFGFGKSF